MADDPPNPYAPPSTPSAPDLQRGLWKCDGCDLWVRTGVLIPDVDLLTGEVQPPDAPLRQISLMPWNVRFLVLMGVGVGGIIGLEMGGSHLGFRIPLLASVAMLWIVSTVVGRWAKVPVWLIRYRQSRHSPCRRARPVMIWLACLLGAFAVSAIAAAFLHSMPVGDRISPIVTGGLLTLPAFLTLVAGGWLLRNKGALGHGGRSGDWLLLRGVHPAALAYLAGLPVFVPPPVHPEARTYVMHLAKCPLREWFPIVGRKFRPCLNILLAKLLNRHALDSQAVIHLKPILLGPQAISPEFVAQVRERESALLAEGWQEVGWNLIPIPDRFNSRMESACFFHPDHRHLLHLSLTRGDSYTGILKTAIRSWLPDGTLLVTTDELCFTSVLPPECEWEALPGIPHAELIHKHMRKSAARGAVALPDARDGLDRLVRMNLANHARMHAKKICGPLEDISP
ncbi:hypothetical protein [Luteolibacter sp. LG18]|uniref:hypothetical protein n=1 Tax=Luteolibacter sp. LG18 TaxID=2819286 RepID=UPI002B294A2B|nr:hypothetical protein llg_15580 [Luteolibacter sp. LG18]